MNVQLHRHQRVFISCVHQDRRFWLVTVANARADSGRLFLKGDWNDDASQARSQTYEIASVIRRRLAEQGVPTQISLVAGDCAEFIEE